MTPSSTKKRRVQITAYLHPDTEQWVTEYARTHGIGLSDLVRLLLQRERRINWLRWAMRPQRARLRHIRRDQSSGGEVRVRPQAVAYVDGDLKRWLVKYAAEQGCHLTDVVRLVVQREQEVKWVAWAFNTDDPARRPAAPLRHRKSVLPKRWNSRP